ncbi:MAG: 50S ribosomal protein L11 methyltransferase [Vampirovibrionales bacterium]|nr:50S ribosomal protein L11 methyltransferase [Vampirovibrionales bacterium]
MPISTKAIATTPLDAYQRTLLVNTLPAEQVVLLEELLWTLDDVISIETLLTGHVDEEVTKGFCITVSPQGQASLEQLKASLSKWLADDAAIIQLQDIQPVYRADWEEAWKQHWHATAISPRLTIIPTWEAATAKPPLITKPLETAKENAYYNLILDPGTAFGTGSHPTTRLVLQRLDALALHQDFSQLSLMDVGCGSGILSIAAALFGCQSIIGLDIHPEAMTATNENATLNGVGHCITATQTPLEDRCHTAMDGIVMNIHAAVIKPLLPEAIARLAPTGWIILSGLLEKDVPAIEVQLAELGLFVRHQATQDGWAVLDAVFESTP